MRPKKEWYDASKTWYLEKRVPRHLKHLHAIRNANTKMGVSSWIGRLSPEDRCGINRRDSALSMREAQILSRLATYPDFGDGRSLEYGERNREADLRDLSRLQPAHLDDDGLQPGMIPNKGNTRSQGAINRRKQILNVGENRRGR